MLTFKTRSVGRERRVIGEHRSPPSPAPPLPRPPPTFPRRKQGLSWPFEETLDLGGFRGYFLSHAAFVVRAIPSHTDTTSDTIAETSAGDSGDKNLEEKSTDEVSEAAREAAVAGGSLSERPPAAGERSSGEKDDGAVKVWGAFYIKPNFPGRCSHVCNGGFITDPRRRRRGVARLMGHAFLRLARDLGYKASYFNLVSASTAVALNSTAV